MYTGHYAKEFEDFAHDAGGLFEFEIRHMNGDVVTRAEFSIQSSKLELLWENSEYASLSELIVQLGHSGYSLTNPDGCNTEGGNKSNAVLGNWAIYAKCYYLGISFVEWLGKDTAEKSTTRTKPAKQPKPKEIKLSKYDQRIMRPMTGKAVWCAEYLKAKGIDHKAFIEKFGKEQVYNDLATMNVYEFETKYGLR